jgi:hypothetical protein
VLPSAGRRPQHNMWPRLRMPGMDSGLGAAVVGRRRGTVGGWPRDRLGTEPGGADRGLTRVNMAVRAGCGHRCCAAADAGGERLE